MCYNYLYGIDDAYRVHDCQDGDFIRMVNCLTTPIAPLGLE